MWTKFTDMYSGGYKKSKFDTIWIESPEDEAIKYFESIFDICPTHYSCYCCGRDFSIEEHEECNVLSTEYIKVIPKFEIEP